MCGVCLPLCLPACLPVAGSPVLSNLPHTASHYSQESGEALLERIRGERDTAAASAVGAMAAAGGGGAGASGELRELTPAEAAKDDGNKAFKRGDWREAAEHYTRWVH